jgi:hypothetical protein
VDLQYVQPPAAHTTRLIGNEQCGVIEMVVRGGLLTRESELIAELEAEHASSLEIGAKLAEAVAAAENITITEAFDIVQAAVREEEMEPAARAIMLRHASEIASIVKLLHRNGRLSRQATVTALIRTRGNRPEWTHADTLTLVGPLFNGIWQLALDEQSAEDMPSSPPTEDELKKPPQDSAPTPKPRGTKSSGS